MSLTLSFLAFTFLLPQVQVREEAKDWKLIQTEHFDVYYPEDGLLPRAKEFAGWFEEARGRLHAKTGTMVSRRIHVFLYRSYHDLLQASFLGQFEVRKMSRALFGRGAVFPDRDPEPKPRFCRLSKSRALALAEPLHDRILIHCQASDRWNQWFLRHELAHHMQFEAMYPWRTPSWLLALKDPLVPAWWWEGGADFWADVFESHKDEYVRDLSMERLYGLTEMYGFDSINFHDFIAPYYEGSYFWRFLDEGLAAGTAKRMFQTYSTATLPFPMKRMVGRVTGKPIDLLNAEFAGHLQGRYARLADGRTDAAAFARRITDSREYYRRRTGAGRFSPDGRSIAYVSDVDTVPELYLAKADGTEAKALLGVQRAIGLEGVHSAPSWSPDGKEIVIAGSWKNRDYLLFVDAEKGGFYSEKMEFDEVYDPCFSPDGASVVFSGLKDGYSDLYVWNDGSITRLTNDRDADAMPAWSPDGKTIVYVSETEARPRLYVLDVATKQRKMLVDSYAVVEHPRWMPDGKSVVVSADVDGVFDLFRIDLQGRTTRLTKVRRGAHTPDPSPDGRKVLFTYFQERGTDLYVMDLQEQEEKGFGQADRRKEYEQFTRPNPQGTPAEKRRSFDVEWLMGPVTSVSFLQPGFEFRLADLDAENSLNAGGVYLGGNAWGVGASVVNSRWQPTLMGAAYEGQSGDLEQSGAAALAFLPIMPTMAVVGGWSARETTDQEPRPDEEFFDSGPVLGAFWTNQSGYHLFDPSWGVALGGVISYFDEDLGGDRDLRESYAFLEGSEDITQDWIVWGQLFYASLDGSDFLDDEVLELGAALRGAEDDFEGRDLGVLSLELRFPLWRDMNVMPFDWLGIGEWIVLKDLRGFVFAQGGYATDHFSEFGDGVGGAVSVGAGLRLDHFFMLFPILNVRVPLRLEVWGALVAADNEDPQGEVGAGFAF